MATASGKRLSGHMGTSVGRQQRALAEDSWRRNCGWLGMTIRIKLTHASGLMPGAGRPGVPTIEEEGGRGASAHT